MARKAETGSNERGLQDVFGIVLLCFAVLLLVSLFSYDRADLSINKVPPNDPKQNWIGPFGAWLGYGAFFLFGASAYLFPVLCLGFGLSYFVSALEYLRRAWPWALLLVVSCSTLLSLYSASFANWKAYLDSGSAGGLLGHVSHQYVFSFFGRVGAPIMLAACYLISLVFLTNKHIIEWASSVWARLASMRGDAGALPATVAEKALEKKARELERQKRRLEEETARQADKKAADKEQEGGDLGADLQPVPEPTVRDLSVPNPKAAKPGEGAAKKSTTPVALLPPAPDEDELPPVEVIPGREVKAATAADILGRGGRKEKTDPADKPAGDGATPDWRPGEPGAAEERPGTPADAALPVKAPAAPAAPGRPAPRRPKPIAVASTPIIGNYKMPPVDLLNPPDPNVRPTESKEELMANARLMQQTLAQFDINVALGDITKGPTITRYELHPAPGVKLEKITALTNNIAAALKAERLNILAPVPGKSSVGVEVPNLVKTKVIMRELFESDEWLNSKARLPLALGKDVYGVPIIADLAEMPHLLIAGSTGSGKSVCINAIVASLLHRFSPDQLRLVMIDPKVVELQQYNALPHLVVPVVNDPKKVILALRWVVNEMEKRYQIFARVGVRNIKSFNERPKDKPVVQDQPELPLVAKKEKVEANAEGFAVEVDEEIVVPRDEDIVIPDKLSYIVVIIDELADLMLVAPADVEMAIARITQMARAAGIHCIVATQRPSVDVITGVIKANIPARIAFQVAAKVDSRTILDAMGADKLLGKGDMLYLPPGSAKLTRAQGVLITDQEIQSIVDYIKLQGKPSYEMEIHQQLQKPVNSFDSEGGGTDEDEDLIQQCVDVIRSEQKASVSLIQRRLRLGYTRAARIMDELENRGIVGPSKGAEPRDILIDLDGGGADGNPVS